MLHSPEPSICIAAHREGEKGIQGKTWEAACPSCPLGRVVKRRLTAEMDVYTEPMGKGRKERRSTMHQARLELFNI
jgi:hypothetical protein